MTDGANSQKNGKKNNEKSKKGEKRQRTSKSPHSVASSSTSRTQSTKKAKNNSKPKVTILKREPPTSEDFPPLQKIQQCNPAVKLMEIEVKEPEKEEKVAKNKPKQEKSTEKEGAKNGVEQEKSSEKEGSKSNSKKEAPPNPPKIQPLMSISNKKAPPTPTIQPLMDVELQKHEKNFSHGGQPSPVPWELQKKTVDMAGKQMVANKIQTQEYYFSENAGSAVSSQTFQESFQYRLLDFPLEKNVNIQIERKINLLITPAHGRCAGLFIRVKSQHGDDSLSSGALLRLDSDDNTIRKACEETIENFTFVSAKGPMDRCPFSKSSEEFLASCFIRRLDERLEAFPEAIYYCEKCDYHINTISHAKVHLESSTHFDDIRRQEQRETLLKKVPQPTKAHLESINNVLNETLEEYQECFQVRTNSAKHADAIMFYLKTKVFPTIEGCSEVELKPFGSSTYDVVLSDSDFNVAYTVELPEGTPIFAMLENIRKKIADDGHKAEHSIEMGTPSTIIFTFESVRVRLCWMSCFNYRSQLYLSELMKTYTDLRPEVLNFLRIIRLWAVRAGVDSKNKARIGMPRYGFDLMSIHFLQQKGYLPVLHELYEEDSNGENVEEEKVEDATNSETSKIQPEEAGQRRIRLMSRYEKNREKILAKSNFMDKKWDTAQLFIDFFRYYVEKHKEVVVQITQLAPMTRDANRWNKKILHVVDPFRGDNVLSIPKVSTWQPYYFNCLLSTFIVFAIPRTANGPVVEVGLFQNKSVSSKKKAKETPKRNVDPSKTIPEITEEQYHAAADELAEEQEHQAYCQSLKNRLVIDGLKFTARKPSDHEIDDHRQLMYSSRALRRFRRVLDTTLNEKIAIPLEEHDLLQKKGKGWIKKWRKNQIQVENLAESMEKSLKVSQEGPDQNEIRVCHVMLEEQTIPLTSSDNIEKSKIQQTIPEDDLKCTPPMTPLLKPLEKMTENSSTPTRSSFIKAQSVNAESSSHEKPICTEEFFIRESFDTKEIRTKSKNLKVNDFRFEFSGEAFCGGYEMEMKCTHCDGSHCVETCPMMEIPPIKKFEPRSSEALKDIDGVIDTYYRNNILDQQTLESLERKKRELESFLKKSYRPDVRLTIFGSVMTGLSVSCSDVDICLRFGEGNEPPKDLTPKEVIIQTEEALRRCPHVKRVQAIVTAKVPIVKFQLKFRDGGTVDADISYYNILAIYNTALLREYTLWTPDNRFAKLALFIKQWAKSCDIGDASRGSLSSYAHIILLISYLQNCDPPVLPRLQEDFRSDNNERRIVENWDTSFAQVENGLLKSWPKNKESCAQLLIGYFDYYSRFDFRNFVIQCRREMMLSKMEKDWPRPLCVEDPFDLNHNLSSGVTKKMFVFIMKVFINSRAVFMSEKPDVSRSDTVNFYIHFRDQLLRKCSQGSAPTDRQCHNCHRIGHFVESCPQRAQAKEARRRYGSNSTASSFRSNGNGGNGGNTFHRRSYPKANHL